MGNAAPVMEESVATEGGLAAAEAVGVGRPATFVFIARGTQVGGTTVPRR